MESIYISYLTLGIDEYKLYDFAFDEENCETITKYIKEHNVEIKRGYIIDTIERGYRNDGKYIWNDTKAIPLDNKIDEYGSVPKEFIVSPDEFNPDDWIDTICHNTYYWPCVKYRKEVSESLKLGLENSDEDFWYGTFKHKGENYLVILDCPAVSQYDQDFMRSRIMDVNIPFSCRNEDIDLSESDYPVERVSCIQGNFLESEKGPVEFDAMEDIEARIEYAHSLFYKINEPDTFNIFTIEHILPDLFNVSDKILIIRQYNDEVNSFVKRYCESTPTSNDIVVYQNGMEEINMRYPSLQHQVDDYYDSYINELYGTIYKCAEEIIEKLKDNMCIDVFIDVVSRHMYSYFKRRPRY